MYAGGSFTSISGTRRRHLAALDRRSGALTPWDPGADTSVAKLLATPAGLIVAGGFGSLAATTHQGLGIFPPTDSGPVSVSHPPLR